MMRLVFAAMLAFSCLSTPLRAETASAVIDAQLTSMSADTAISGAAMAAPDFLRRFYSLRDNRPAWHGTPEADALEAALSDALVQGFRPPDFHYGILLELRDTAAGGDAGAIASYELVATDAAIRLIHHLVYGKVDPKALDPAWNFDQPVIERAPEEVLNEYLSGPGFGALIKELEISNFEYLQLIDVLARYRGIAEQGGWDAIAEGGPLKPDAQDSRVPALRARLMAEGAEIAPGEDETLYDAPLVMAVQAFQLRHGLNADGVIGPRTLASLNQPVSDRIDKLRLSLERFRWYLRGLGSDFVLVNIAGARTVVVLDGRPAWATRSITGTEFRQTPVFADTIKYMEFNPTWTVPNSIFRKDKLAQIRKDSGYLERNNYKVRNSAGKVVSPGSVNWSAKSPKVSLVQQPGPNNALGRVKFMFPNDYAVYLHDTNNRDLFDRDERNLSSGCVRVEDPFVLAGLLMRKDPSWTQERMQQILDSAKTTRVDLPEPMPVLLTYWTAWVEDGEAQFREDPYERDPAVLKALDADP